jgi:hypothetical protein
MTLADTVNTWFRERLATGAIARNTEAYNQAHDAIPDLIARLDPPSSAEASATAGEATDQPEHAA